MATLEVHDAEGRVQYVEISRDHPVLFGTSPACDVVLSGEGINPVHGRIRWKKTKFRVEASPDAQYVLVNGHKMTSSSLHQGDEMTVGSCRIFLLRVDDEVSHDVPIRPARYGDEERTKVLEGSGALRAVGPSTRSTRPVPSKKRSTTRPSALEADDWFEEMGLDADAKEIEEPDEDLPFRPQDEMTPGRLARLLRVFRRKANGEVDEEGEERIVSSPLVIGLIATLILLIFLGLGLRTIILKTLANQRYNAALQLFEDGDYRTAIRDFTTFLESHPQDPRTGKARVLRALANVRQYVSITGGTWSTALQAAHEMYDTVGDEPEFRDERTELADLVIRIGEALADRARHAADAEALREAESAVPFHAELAGEPAANFLKRSRLPDLLREGRAAVRKADVRAQSLRAMDDALKAGSASGVYKARDALLAQYADLAQDRDLIPRMTQANDLIRKSARLDPTKRAAQTTEREETLGPAVSLVLRTPTSPASADLTADSLVHGLADGMAYAIDSKTGAPVWQRPVGLNAPFPPRPIAGDGTVLVVDSRFDELLRLDAKTGRLRWRLALGEPVDGAPMIQGNLIFQVIPSGKVVVISLQSGEIQATIDLGLPLARGPAGDEQGRFLYVIGRHDCLFVLKPDPLECLAVEYLGHREDSIPCDPLRVGRFLIIPENDRPADSRWRVMVLDDDGAKLRHVQWINVPGWTWSVPASSGSIIWAAGDTGGLEAYTIGDYASKTPLRSVARLNSDAKTSGPALGLATSEHELWLAAGRSGMFELSTERGQIAIAGAVPQTGPALAPVQLGGSRIVMTFQDARTGGVALVGVDTSNRSVAWQTILGAPWPDRLGRAEKDGSTVILGQDGRAALISSELLKTGGFVTFSIPRPGDLKLPPGDFLTLGDQAGAGQVEVLVPSGETGSIWVRDLGKSSTWNAIELPATIAAAPLPWGRELLLPGLDGRVYLIDPITAESRAEPLVPPYDRDRKGRWLAPVPAREGQVILVDDAGKMRRLAIRRELSPRLIAEAETLLDQPIIASPASTGDAVIVATADRKIRSLSTRDLSPVGSWPLNAPLVDQPRAIGGRVFVYLEDGGVICFGPEGRRLWEITLSAPAVGDPAIIHDRAWIIDRNGRLHECALADGAIGRTIDLQILPAGGLTMAGSQAIIPVALGAVRTLSLETATNPENPAKEATRP